MLDPLVMLLLAALTVTLAIGDIVPADLKLTTANEAQLDESALTGESAAVTPAGTG